MPRARPAVLGRAPFALSQVRALTPDGAGRTVFEEGRAHGPGVLLPCLPVRDGLDATRATVRLLTPLRLKSRSGLATTLDFRSLVFAALRRVLELAHFYVPGAAIDWNFRDLLDRAAAVRTVRSNLAWHDWERYSNRQQTHMVLGGLLGTLDLEGDLAPFAPLFEPPRSSTSAKAPHSDWEGSRSSRSRDHLRASEPAISPKLPRRRVASGTDRGGARSAKPCGSFGGRFLGVGDLIYAEVLGGYVSAASPSPASNIGRVAARSSRILRATGLPAPNTPQMPHRHLLHREELVPPPLQPRLRILKQARSAEERRKPLHLFASAPNALLFFLGQLARSFGEVQIETPGERRGMERHGDDPPGFPELKRRGHQTSHRLVAEMLHELGYSLQANRKSLEGTGNPDRDAQFEYINRLAQDYFTPASAGKKSILRSIRSE